MCCKRGEKNYGCNASSLWWPHHRRHESFLLHFRHRVNAGSGGQKGGTRCKKAERRGGNGGSCRAPSAGEHQEFQIGESQD